MIAFARRLAVGAVLAGTAIGVAAPAPAEFTDGNYEVLFAAEPTPERSMHVESCGADCKRVHVAFADQDVDFHLQGKTWTGHSADGTVTIDNTTLAGSVNGTDSFQLTNIP